MSGTVPFPPRGWRAQLAKSPKGNIIPSDFNALHIFTHDQELANLLAINTFNAAICLKSPVPSHVVTGAPNETFPRPLTDDDYGIALVFLQQHYSHQFSYPTIKRAMNITARKETFHPVLQWLSTLVWDKKPRIDTWLTTAFGAVDNPLNQAIGARFLIAAVRRVRNGGCQFDHIPVLEGPQGIGKSRACRLLFSDRWFTDDLPHDLKNKDSPQSLLGMWGVELSEIAQLASQKNGIETVKAFISRRVDRFRPPYGHGFIEFPRQTVMIGTTNRDDWLSDETGNRRLWPVKCTKADHQWVADNRDQLWAEAAEAEALDEPLWLNTPELQHDAHVEQEKRREEDIWAPIIRAKLVGKAGPIQLTDILSDMEVPLERQDKRAQMRVAAVVKVEGWIRETMWDATDKKVKKFWTKPNAAP